jgi:hypothetical protein
MKANLVHSSISLMVSTFLLVSLSFALVGCTNTGAYKHTTVVKASAEELDINALGVAPLIHVKDGTLTVTITTQISLGNAVMK